MTVEVLPSLGAPCMPLLKRALHVTHKICACTCVHKLKHDLEISTCKLFIL